MGRRIFGSVPMQSAVQMGIVGTNVLLAPVATCIYGLGEISVASNGVAGSGVLSSNGVEVGVVRFTGNSMGVIEYANVELGAGSGLDIFLSTPASVTTQYVCWDITPGITKSAARAATYAASLLSPKAIRTPNRRGEQTEG